MAINSDKSKLDILLIGSGVIDSVYATQFALSGHNIHLLNYGPREHDLQANGLIIKDISTGKTEKVAVQIVQSLSDRVFGLVIVAVQATQLSSVFPMLGQLSGQPHVVIFGNNPDGHKLIPKELSGSTQLAFPGVSGSIQDGVVKYVHIKQQSTALEGSQSPINQTIHQVLNNHGFIVQDIDDMDGWLSHHAVFISCISVAILRANGDATKLGQDKPRLKLMCKAIEEGFYLLKSKGTGGAPHNLAVLHSHWLRLVAVAYWKKVMLSPNGELYFATHARHAPEEISMLSRWVLNQTTRNNEMTPHLQQLLNNQ
ncbi:MAG: 2-dehydropantoate 2-reductase N-terminal domain-containing protein [Candidatus Saccharimonadales bacterium]